MATNLSTLDGPGTSVHLSDILPSPSQAGDTRLLLQAFEMFTQASSSLETAFQQLQEHARNLSEELEAKNQELEQSLREKEEVETFLKNILENLPCGVLVLDEAGSVRMCNPVASKLLEQPLGKQGKGKGRIRRLRNQSLREYFQGSLSPMGEKRETEIPLFVAGKMRVLATSGSSLDNASGNPSGTLHIIRDITEMKALQEQSKRGERLSAMGEMAVELAHEIRNPLGSIELFASLLEKELRADSDMGRWAENIRMGSRSLNNIVSNMLHFANPFSPSFAEVDVHSVITEILNFTEPIMRQRDVNVDRSFAASDPKVLGDRELLKQMILNLVLNAMQAMPSKGNLTLSTRSIAQLPGGAACGGIEIRIRDSGIGIPPENLKRVFDPFFTTNKNGTGLGLSVVHQIVDRHSGFINIESEVNVGTAFTIVLPSRQLASGAA
jgi:PAS domain S-box-containing protein